MLDRSRRVVATGLTLSVAMFLVAPVARAGEAAVLTGKVFEADGRTPRTGVVVHLVDPENARDFGSEPSHDDGTFRIDQAPAGTYRVLADTSEGAFLAASTVTVEPGANRPVSLALGGAAPSFQSSSTPQTSGGGLPTWGKWAIAGGIALAALFVIDEVTDDEDEPASPS